MSRILSVYLQENLVGNLEQKEDGQLTFTYDTDYLQAGSYGLSLSLPLKSESYSGQVVKAFFSGLLPEESVRNRLARYLGLSEENSFALLEAVGGECAGALGLYPYGTSPPAALDDAEVLDDHRLTEVLNLIKRRPMLAGDDGYRLSLAGAQDKLAVGFQKGHIVLLKGGAPTTHILKPIIEHINDSAHNELFCMKLAKIVGLDVPEVSLHFVGNTPYYLIERYDRQIDNRGVITRIHQEDFCQALGMPPEIKYEREGGPSISDCQNLIAHHVARPAADQLKLLNIILFNYLIGNADAHGKNFSLLYKSVKPELAPAYDLLSTAVYPDVSIKMAMKIGGKYKPKDICWRHFYKLVAHTKTAQSGIRRQIQVMTEKISTAAPSLKTTLAADGITSPIFDKIISLIQIRVKSLKK